jgi:hypothetical protein
MEGSIFAPNSYTTHSVTLADKLEYKYRKKKELVRGYEVVSGLLLFLIYFFLYGIMSLVQLNIFLGGLYN